MGGAAGFSPSLLSPLQYPPPLIPPRGEVNAADAFDIGSFDEEDTRGIKVHTSCWPSVLSEGGRGGGGVHVARLWDVSHKGASAPLQNVEV